MPIWYNNSRRELLPPSEPIHIKPKSIVFAVLFRYKKHAHHFDVRVLCL